MEKKMYFKNPTQVIWIDEEGSKQAGIAYRDEKIGRASCRERV